MLKLKRLFALSGLTALVAAAAFVAPASAEVKGECFVNGDAKTQDKANPNIGVRVMGGQGKFTFQQLQISCMGDTNKDGVPEPIVGVVATATGWYDNIVCGTGKALGTVTNIENAPAKVIAALEGKKFGIEFRAFNGVFKWHEPGEGPLKDVVVDKDDPASPQKEDNPDKNYTPAGTITLGPPATKPADPPELPIECTKAFSATGVVKVWD